MSDCCSSFSTQISSERKHRCPVNGIEYPKVSMKTILHHIKTPWRTQIKEQGYYYCDDPDCEVVYFGQDDSLIRHSEIRHSVGIKTKTHDSLICYCFGVTQFDAIGKPETREYVAQKTKEKLCSCETSNPSGRCCLKDFPTRK